jgi:transposase
MADHFDGPQLCDDADFRTIRYRDLLPSDHPARFIEQFVGGLDISRFEAHYKVGDGQKGRAPKEIRMMLSVILYALYCRIYSSRRIDYATQHQADFWFFTYGQRISHDKISDFIIVHEAEIHAVFLQTIHVAHTNKLLDFKWLYQDGFMLKANASTKRTSTLAGLSTKQKRLSDRLQLVIEQLKNPDSAAETMKEKEHIENRLKRIGQLQDMLNAKIAQRSEGIAPGKAAEIAKSTTINETDSTSDLMKQKDDSFANSFLKVCATDAKADIVVASVVDGYNDEPHMSLPLFKQANENCEGKGQFDSVVADCNFTTMANAEAFEQAHAQLLGPTRAQENESRNGTPAVSFTYDEQHHCLHCTGEGTLTEEQRYWDKYKKTTIVVFSNRSACAVCALRSACTASAVGYRRVKWDIRAPAQQRVLQRYNSDEGKAVYKKRAHCAETYQGDLKHNGRFIQVFRRGLSKVRVDSLWQDTVWNLRRIFNTKGMAVVWA